MAGKPGRSGRPQLPLSHHVLRGTYRADRHGPLAANVVPMPVAPGGWHPSPTECKTLGPAGVRFLELMLASYEFVMVEGVLVLEAARAADALAAWHARAAIDGPDQARHSRLALGWQRQFAQLIAQLKVNR